MATSPPKNPFTVNPRSNFPLVEPNHNPIYIAVSPPPQAASVVLAATRPIPSASIADKVLPGLNPYHPNHKINPPTAATVRLCGAGIPPPSRAKIRPILGPNTTAPARDAIPRSYVQQLIRQSRGTADPKRAGTYLCFPWYLRIRLVPRPNVR